MDGLAVCGPAAVDVVEGEEGRLGLSAAGALSPVGVEDCVSQLAVGPLSSGADEFGVGSSPLGVFVPESLAVGCSPFGVTGPAAGLADVAPADGRGVADELRRWPRRAASLTGASVHLISPVTPWSLSDDST